MNYRTAHHRQPDMERKGNKEFLRMPGRELRRSASFRNPDAPAAFRHWVWKLIDWARERGNPVRCDAETAITPVWLMKKNPRREVRKGCDPGDGISAGDGNDVIAARDIRWPAKIPLFPLKPRGLGSSPRSRWTKSCTELERASVASIAWASAIDAGGGGCVRGDRTWPFTRRSMKP